MVLFVHRPEYYHILTDEKGNDLRGMAQIIIAKHRKGATGDILLTFRGEFTRFQDPVKQYADNNNPFGSEIMGSKMNSIESPVPPNDMISDPLDGGNADILPY